MANRRLPMRKIKEILRLHFQARLSARQIARCCSVSRATVGEYLNRTRAVQLDWKLRWPRLVGQLGGLFKVYSDCHSYRQNLLGQICLSLLLRL